MISDTERKKEEAGFGLTFTSVVFLFLAHVTLFLLPVQAVHISTLCVLRYMGDCVHVHVQTTIRAAFAAFHSGLLNEQQLLLLFVALEEDEKLASDDDVQRNLPVFALMELPEMWNAWRNSGLV